jgi:hypothetical protein
VVRLAGPQAEDLEVDGEQHVQQLHVGDVRVAPPQPDHRVLEPDVGRIPLPCDRLLQQHTHALSPLLLGALHLRILLALPLELRWNI